MRLFALCAFLAPGSIFLWFLPAACIAADAETNSDNARVSNSEKPL